MLDFTDEDASPQRNSFSGPMELEDIETVSSKIEGTVWRTSRQVYLCRWKRHLARFPPS